MTALKLIVGLGNPGKRYERNRHNAGFICIDVLAKRHGIAVDQRRFKALVGEGTIAGERVVLVKPQTFMNLSGEAVRSLQGWYKVSPSDILVIYDDMDLPLGKIRIREKGSSGGHRGVQSIIDWLKTQDFPRLRIGIGRREGSEAREFVLEDFTDEEKTVMEEAFNRSADAIETLLTSGIAVAMNKYNR